MAYLFQKDTLLIPPEMDGQNIVPAAGALDPERIQEALAASSPAASGEKFFYFETPSLNGSGKTPAFLLDDGAAAPPLWKAVSLRSVLSLTGSLIGEISGGEAAEMLRSYHIMLWRRDSAFCGSCGNRNSDSPDEQLARLCPACGRLEFPRISPAVIVIITNDRGEALLAHNIKFRGGVYSLVAGFNEAGESLEATVVREIREEVGIEVRDIRYIASQPWPFPNSLMIGFSARHASGVIKPDGVEIGDARWFSRENLPDIPQGGSVSRYLIDMWLNS